MIDFRYHIVSLVAVFLALAVGIVLGNGPMRDALIGDQAETIASLEDETSQLQTELDVQAESAAAGEQFADETSTRLLAGALGEVSVATLDVGTPSTSDSQGIRDRLVQAGAALTAQVVVEPAWTDPQQVAFRNSLASTVASQVVGSTDDMTSTTVLAHALAQALMPGVVPVGAEADDYAADAEERAGALFELLVDAELVSGTVTAPSSAVAMIAGSADEEAGADSAVYAEIAGVLGLYADGIVASSGLASSGDLPTAIANSPSASPVVSTVSTGTGYFGQISSALALAENIGGSVGQYAVGGESAYVPTP